MRIIKPSMEILTPIDRVEILKDIEIAGRTCYKSENNISAYSASVFVSKIVKSGHLSVIEHKSITVRFICDRGVTHEMVRHRLSSFSQESTRYCNYGKGEHLTFIKPCFFPNLDSGVEIYSEDLPHFIEMSGNLDSREFNWLRAMSYAEDAYLTMIREGATPQEARSVLPNSLKSEIVVTANLRQWKEILRQRTAKAAHPQIREVMEPLLEELKKVLPEIFKD